MNNSKETMKIAKKMIQESNKIDPEIKELLFLVLDQMSVQDERVENLLELLADVVEIANENGLTTEGNKIISQCILNVMEKDMRENHPNAIKKMMEQRK